jgi:hypothetical protein
MNFDESLPGLARAIGTVPDDHPLANEWRFSPDFVRTVDARYQSVFLNSRFLADAGRLDQLRHDLASPKSFSSADAEVQAAATVLRDRAVTVLAEAAGDVRRCDYLVRHDRDLEVEVRLLQDRADDLRFRDAQARITKRLEAATLPSGLLLTVQVVSLEDPNEGGHALTGRAERALAEAVVRAAANEPWRLRPVLVTLHASGEPEVCHPFSDRSDELASVELRAVPSSRRRLVMGWSGLRPVADADRVDSALKKKGDRKQRSGTRPWIVVLDASDSRLRDPDEMREGAERRFRASEGTLSAVVIQILSLKALTGGIAISRDDVWASVFSSAVILNPDAVLPLTEREIALLTDRAVVPAAVGPNARDAH